MSEARAITGWDRASFLAYCCTWAEWSTAERVLPGLEVGLGGAVETLAGMSGRQSPPSDAEVQALEVVIASTERRIKAVTRTRNAAHDRMVKLATELRLSPVSRSRAPIPKSKREVAEVVPEAESADPRAAAALRLVAK